MPRGGRRPGAGRPKGSQSKNVADAREAFRLVYERRLEDLDRWIRETGDGYEVERPTKGGTITYLVRDPAKAADLIARMAEHFVPKLSRREVVGEGGGPVAFVIRDLAKEE